MKFVLVFVLCIVSFAHAADKKTSWWGRFCEKHLIADDPYYYEELVVDWRLRYPNDDEFAAKLVDAYRAQGAALYWAKGGPSGAPNRAYLITLGNTLRDLNKKTPRKDVLEILDAYSGYELP